jgi:hypothetical protein
MADTKGYPYLFVCVDIIRGKQILIYIYLLREMQYILELIISENNVL